MNKKFLSILLVIICVFTSTLSVYASDYSSIDVDYVVSEVEFQLIKSAIDCKIDELNVEEIPDTELADILKNLGLEHIQWRRTVDDIRPRANLVGTDFINMCCEGDYAETDLVFLYAWSF